VIPDWALKYLGETEVAETDPLAEEPISWGKRVVEKIPEDLFDSLRSRCEMVCNYPDWYLIGSRVQFADLMIKHGGVRFVGVGPGGGFKWVRFADGSTWGSPSLRTGAIKELAMNPRLGVKCDKDGREGGELPRIPRRTIGRAGKK
jgi:hypothetical protein